MADRVVNSGLWGFQWGFPTLFLNKSVADLFSVFLKYSSFHVESLVSVTHVDILFPKCFSLCFSSAFYVVFFPISSLCIFCSVGSSLSCFLELLVSYWHLSCLLLLCGWAGSLSEASVILHLIFALGCLKCIDHVFCFLWFFSAFFQNLIFIVVSYCSSFSQRIWTGPTSGFKQMV